MTSPVLLALLIVGIALAAVYAIWDLRTRFARQERRAQVIQWRIDREADMPAVTLDGAYADAIRHTLTRADLVTADQLADRLMQARKPRAFEVVA